MDGKAINAFGRVPTHRAVLSGLSTTCSAVPPRQDGSASRGDQPLSGGGARRPSSQPPPRGNPGRPGPSDQQARRSPDGRPGGERARPFAPKRPVAPYQQQYGYKADARRSESADSGFEVISSPPRGRTQVYPATGRGTAGGARAGADGGEDEEEEGEEDPLDGARVWRELSGWQDADEEEEGEEGGEDGEDDEGEEGEDDDLDDGGGSEGEAAVIGAIALAAAMAAETPDQQQARRRLTGREFLPRHMGAIQFATIPGRGRGVVTTAAVGAGEVLMTATPFLGPVLFCEGQGETPENEALAQHLMTTARLGARQHALLDTLFYGGSSETGTAGLPSPSAEADSTSPSAAGAAGEGGASADAAASSSSSPAPPADTAASISDGLGAAPAASDSRPAVARLGGRSRGGGRAPAKVPGARRSRGPAPALLTLEELQAAADEGDGTSSSSSSSPEHPLSPIRLSGPRLEAVVNFNCMGEEFTDIAATALAGAGVPRGHLGVWPEPSLLNHSCLPTATTYTLGDRLTVVATEALAAGDEVTVSYLGAMLTSPLALRRSLLQEQYGFHCGCARCRLEEELAGRPLEQQLDSTYARCQELASELDALIDRSDESGVRRCLTQLLALRDEFEAVVRLEKASNKRVNAKSVRWLHASVYDLFDLISLAADQVSAMAEERKEHLKPGTGSAGQLDTEALAVCTRLVEAVAPGSDGHCALAAEFAERAQARFGEKHEEAKQARTMCDVAFRTRYGPHLSTALLRQLVQARLQADEED